MKKVISLFDVHIPHQIDLTGIFKFLKDEKPDYLILGGDIMNIDSLSHWSIAGGKRLTLEGKRFQKECDEAGAFLDKLRECAGDKCQIVYLLGNHESTSRDTEFLTSEGWIRADELKDDMLIAQFDIDTKKISYSKPNSLIEHFAEEMILVEGGNTKQCVTLNHDVVVDGRKIKAQNLQSELNETQFTISSNRELETTSGFTEEDIRLLTWVIMDGTIVDDSKYIPNSIKKRIQFKLSKQRKIDKLRELLDSLDINYTFKKATKSGVNKLQPYYIRIYGDEARRIFSLLDGEKKIPSSWADMNKEELDIFLETLLDTDGSISYGKIVWNTISRNDVDIIFKACIQNNIPFKYKSGLNRSGFKNGKLQYNCSINNNRKFNTKVHTKKIKYNDYAYCVNMPKGTIITRLDGKIAFTGNCWTNQYIDQHPEMSGIIDLPIMLKLDERKIKWISYKSKKNYFKVGKLYFTHGEYTNEHHAKKMLNSWNCNIRYGHLHSHSVYTRTSKKGVSDFHKAISIPCLCKDGDYLEGKSNNWELGFHIAYVKPSGNFFEYMIPIIDNQFFFNNKIYGV